MSIGGSFLSFSITKALSKNHVLDIDRSGELQTIEGYKGNGVGKQQSIVLDLAGVSAPYRRHLKDLLLLTLPIWGRCGTDQRVCCCNVSGWSSYL